MKSKEELEEMKIAHPKHGHPWSAKDVELLEKRFNEGASVDDLVNEFQRTRNGIKRQLRRMGYQSDLMRKIRAKSPNAFKSWTEDEDATLIAMYTSREKLRIICDTLGRSVNAVAQRLLKHDL